MARAAASPDATFSVIVQGDRRPSEDLAKDAADEGAEVKRAFRSISGAHVSVSGKDLVKLARHPHITSITEDSTVSLTGYVNSEAWRQTVNANKLWSGPQAPAIAVVDSGVGAAQMAMLGTRIAARANFSSREPSSTGDSLGHGTMVATIAASNNSSIPGVARNAPIVDVDVTDSQGEALTSDIIAGIDWILANKGAYNIRVANFSLVGDAATSFQLDPLDKAVEKLWLNGVVVVAAAGNNGSSGPVGIGAPANDPFVITVGATDIRGTGNPADDVRAPWSAYGYTADGFAKPELAAPGRYMIGGVPLTSTLALRHPERILSSYGFMWMSGTSFSAPVVAGAAAQLLARHPDWTPDQVKGALMLTTSYNGVEGIGVGEIDALAAAGVTSPPNPNENLYAFVNNGVFEADKWAEHVSANSNWTMSNWSASNWSASNWVNSNWSASNWSASNWVASNWVASNWVASNWSASNWIE